MYKIIKNGAENPFNVPEPAREHVDEIYRFIVSSIYQEDSGIPSVEADEAANDAIDWCCCHAEPGDEFTSDAFRIIIA